MNQTNYLSVPYFILCTLHLFLESFFIIREGLNKQSLVLLILLWSVNFLCRNRFLNLARKSNRNIQALIIKEDDLYGKQKKCQICKSNETSSIHHCEFCNRCQYRAEKHSFWLGKCIEQEDKVSYFRLMFLHWVYCLLNIILLFYISIMVWSKKIKEKGYDRGIDQYTGVKIYQELLTQNYYLFYFAFYSLTVAFILYTQLAINFKMMSFPLTQKEREKDEKFMADQSQIIQDTIDYLQYNEIDYEDKNEIKEMIMDQTKHYLLKRRVLKPKEDWKVLMKKIFMKDNQFTFQQYKNEKNSKSAEKRERCR